MKAVFGKIYAGGRFFRRMLIDGRAVSFDDSEEIPEGAQVLDFRGRIIAPPLYDCHIHFFQTGIYLRSVSLRGISNLPALWEKLRSTDPDAHRIGEILWLWGFDPADRMPTAAELEKILPGIPVVLRRVDGHSCSLSESAQKFLPAQLRRPDGVYSGEAQEKVIEFFLKLTPADELKKSALRAAEYARSAGALRICVLVPYLDWAVLLREIALQLPVDIQIFVESADVDAVADAGFENIGGCLLLDGSFGSHTAALFDPYADDPQNRGILYWRDDDLTRFFAHAAERGLRVAMHAIGDRAVEQYLRCAEKISGGSALAGWRIEHAELIHPDQIERATALELTLSVQPAFEAFWGGPDGLYAKRLGDRWRLTNPFPAILDAGINLIGGSDSYVTPIDPVFGIRSAANHPNPAHRLDPARAISLFADNPAIWEGRKNPYLFRGEVVLSVIDETLSAPPKIVALG
ncbi:amidohydrolase family protein [bacterium]|nr:amidohydrolase family protein [bacterium]